MAEFRGLSVIALEGQRGDAAHADGPARPGEPGPAPAGDTPLTVVFVHGSLDRGGSFARVARRLSGMRLFAYDRRGYGDSRGAGPTDLAGHIDDLSGLVTTLEAGDTVVPGVATAGPVLVVGHSFGGVVALGAALAVPEVCGAVVAYEPPMPWLGFRRSPGPGVAPGTPRPWPAVADDPGVEAERFFRRMMGDRTWERLGEEARDERRRDGPALVADLRAIRGPAPFDVTALKIPAVFGTGGPGSSPHHRATVTWLGDHVPGATRLELAGATHGAHLSSPDGFAALVRAGAAAATRSDSR
jgi:pimeloyl-ACP methyl ester carboxylesterase